jgi:hypothetical protein
MKIFAKSLYVNDKHMMDDMLGYVRELEGLCEELMQTHLCAQPKTCNLIRRAREAMK